MAIMGTEQEYGIALAGADPARAPHPSQLSNAVIRAWRDETGSHEVGFDLESEAPLADMWGFRLPRAEAHPDLLTDESPLASRMLTNGARFYVDHAHPEFSGPEVRSAIDAVRYDRAGDLVMAAAGRTASQSVGQEIRLFKNNTDGKGQSYGSHENYLIPRELPFDAVVVEFTAYLATRGVITGAGRVGIGRESERPGFQLTQRADFFEREVGLETTIRRPIINTRDEPHANPRRWRRLHVITGDANQAQTSVLIKVGGAALVLGALAAGFRAGMLLADPVAAMHTTSHDLTLTATVPLADGRRLTALDVQEVYWELARGFVADQPGWLPDAAAVLAAWRDAIDGLRRDPASLADRLDWVAKRAVLERYRQRDGLDWDAPRLAAVDLQWADIDPNRGLAYALERSGRLCTLVDPADAAASMTTPPDDTRAWLRGTLLRRFGDHVNRVGWDSVTLTSSRGVHHTVRMAEPEAWTREDWEARLARVTDADELCRVLGERGSLSDE